MKHTTLIAVSVAALALAGCKKEAPAGDAMATSAAADSTIPGVTPAAEVQRSPSQVFADTAAASDAFEIATSQLAADKASSAKVKTFAQQMIKAHTESSKKLEAAAASATPKIVPDAAMTAQQQQVLSDLQGKSGAEFDKAYAAAQVDAHQSTLNALKAYATGGDVAGLKSFATEMIPAVTAHFNMAKGL